MRFVMVAGAPKRDAVVHEGDHADLDALVAEPIEFTGAARAQVNAVVDEIEHLVAERPDAAVYTPEPIL